MPRALVYLHGHLAGTLEEAGGRWTFCYDQAYLGPPVSLALPQRAAPYHFDTVPPFFDGLLPEGLLLEGLLRSRKLDRHDYFGQLLAVGLDVVGAVTLEEAG